MTEVADLSVEEELVVLQSEREDIFSTVQTLFNKSQGLNVKNVDSFSAEITMLDQFLEDFKRVNAQIRRMNVRIKQPKDRVDTSQALHRFVEVVNTIKNTYLKVSRRSGDEVKEVKGRIPSQLPRLQLPTFSGRIEDWMEFWGLFESLVHQDQQLDEVAKFHYLRTCIKGDALSVISGFPLESKCYALAVEALKSRYQNTRRLGSMYVNRILNFIPMSDASLTSLERFLSTHANSMNALDALGLPDVGDFMKLQIALNNLDVKTRTAFEEEQKPSSIPTYKSLIDFVTQRCRMAELLSGGKAKAVTAEKSAKPAKREENRKPHIASVSSARSSSPVQSKGKPSSPSQGNRPSTPVTPRKEVTPPKSQLHCWNCSGPHVYLNCDQPRKRFCYRCGRPEVTVKDCPKCSGGNSRGGQRRGSL